MDLNSKLTEIRNRSKERTPIEIKEKMEASANALAKKSFDVISVGDKLPDFKLEGVGGEFITHEDIVKPTIITFYRGGW